MEVGNAEIYFVCGGGTMNADVGGCCGCWTSSMSRAASESNKEISTVKLIESEDGMYLQPMQKSLV